jgi:hypothetical protein
MSFRRRLHLLALLLAALSALLIFAAAASAETRTGESTMATTTGSPAPEATLVKASGSYETTGGGLSVSFTTEAEPQANVPDFIEAIFFTPTSTSGCSLSALQAEAFAPPAALLIGSYSIPTAQAALIPGFAGLTATRAVSGTTTTLAVTSFVFANKRFDCVFVDVSESESTGDSYMTFPITAPPALPAHPAPVSAPAPAAPPALGPPVLSIARPKALELKVGKSKTVKVKVTNTGATATGKGTLTVKAPTGVLVRPGKQQFPALPPGRSSTLSIRVELTEKAKAKSMLSLTGTASGLTAKGSLVVKQAK